MNPVELKTISLTQIKAHPQNPRAMMRQHVVAGIVEGIRRANGFKLNHAITVRPANGHYEVISGHHRIEAAKLAGLDSLPCWVEVMDDETAFYELIRNNNQGELSPLEIGLHALEYVEAYQEGGIRKYSQGVGLSEARISRYRQAAKVFRKVIEIEIIENSNVHDAEALLSKAHHLEEIHSAPPACWRVLAKLMLAKGWTIQEARKAVKRANEYQISQGWESLFLPLPDVVHRGLDTAEFSPTTIKRIIEAVEMAESRLLTYKIDHLAYLCEFRNWLIAYCFRDSWDARKIVEKGRELQARAEAEEREAQARFLLGDWREHVEKLPNESVSLLLTDPPYGMDYQSDYRLDRELDRKHERITADKSPETAADEIKACLTAFLPKLKPDSHALVFCHWTTEHAIKMAIEAAGLTIRGSLIWLKNNAGMGDTTTTFAPKHERILHAVKGSPTLFSRAADVIMADRCNTNRHPTEKPVDLLRQLIEVTTAKGELVVDPFAGVASTLVAAQALERTFFGCEIDEGYFNQGSERL